MSLPKWVSYLLTVMLCLGVSVIPASAENNEPLSLTSSTVVDGDTNLSIHPVIELQFSGKVDDLTVVSQNKDCFHLQDTTGMVVPLQVIFPDVQVQTRLVNHIFLVPAQELLPGATYTLTIDSTLSDKKSHTLVQSYPITFTTGTDELYARGAENEDLLSLGEDIITYESALAPAIHSVSATTTVATGSETSSRSSSSKLLYAAIAALILLLGGVGLWNWKSSRSSIDA